MERDERLHRGPVIVAGFAGRLGLRLVRALHRERSVIAMDSRTPPGLPQDVSYFPLDPLRTAASQVFRQDGVGAIVYLGTRLDRFRSVEDKHSHSVRTLERVFEYAQQFQIPKVVVLSSAMAYGPRPDNPQFLTESAPLLAGTRSDELRTLVELDMCAQNHVWRNSGAEVVILRPTNILGTVQNAASNYLRLPVVPTLLGYDPMLQAVHQDDVVRALILALAPRVSGVYNIAGPPPQPLSKVIRALRRKTVAVPHPFAKQAMGGLFMARLSRFPSSELDFLRFVCMVDDRAARQKLGYTPRFGIEDTLAVVDEARWVS
jgi:UDP-glucose 4-epimerase